MSGPGTNTGHGHVWPRPDGVRARCGGPAMCQRCAIDAAITKQVKEPDMQTNQTPGALGEEALDIALALRTARPGSEYRIAYVALEAAINRLRDMAASRAKDAEAATLLRVIQRLNQNPYSLTKSECIDEVAAMREAAIAATKRGGA